MKKNKLKIRRNYNEGMTYVELIVVLAIFAVLSSVVLYNYREFQAKVDIKNLASDIALKIVEAQKSALSGELSTQDFTSKPAYGVYFDLSPSSNFVYFADFDNNSSYLGDDDNPQTAEKLDPITITKGNSIDKIYYNTGTDTEIIAPLSITFKRPDSRAVFTSAALPASINYIQINIKSPQGAKAFITVYPSGRIQVN